MNTKTTRILTFVCLLTTILLLSLFIGTSLLAKPNNPNKPDNPGEHETTILSDFKIWIGNGDLGSPEDVVLRPYGDPPIDYLLQEDFPHWEPDWLPPPKKGRDQSIGSWDIHLYKDIPPGPDYCGTYNIVNKLGGPGYEEVALLDTMVAHGFSSDLEAGAVDIHHVKPKVGKREGDYWMFHIGWGGENFPTEGLRGGINIQGNTNKDAECEGVYDQASDTWTVTFDNEWFMIVENIHYPDGQEVTTTLWEGPLSFTIEIQRTLND